MGKLLFGVAMFAVAMIPNYSFGGSTQKVRFCTGESGLPYSQVGKAIRALNARSHVMSIELVENTGGSKSNLDRLLDKDSSKPGNCDMAIMQPSALSEAAKLDMSLRSTIQQVGTGNTEYIHLLCSRASGVTSIRDFVKNPSKYSIALGSDASGAWSVWQSLKEAEPTLSQVSVTAEDQALALVAVSNNNTACTLFPEGLRGKWMNTADATFRESVRLASADLGSFGKVMDFRGNPMFEYKTIPSKFYGNIQTGFWGSSVGTVAWKAGIYVNTDKITDPAVINAIVTLVAKAKPTIVNNLDIKN